MEPDYYDKAVAWDSTLALETRSRELGWQLDASLTPAADGGIAEAHLTDARGVPVSGASMTMAAIHNRNGGRFVTATLTEHAPGAYRATLPLHHFGRWELRFDARLGTRRFVATLRREFAAGPRE
jgi:nitrogen fixation protein FixH